MKGKLVILAVVAAVAVALYLVFRPSTSTGTGLFSGIHPTAPFASGTAGSIASPISSLAASFAKFFSGVGGGSATPVGGTLPYNGSPTAGDTPAQLASYDYAIGVINNNNLTSTIQPVNAPISTTLSPSLPDYSELNALSTFDDPSGSLDYASLGSSLGY